MLCAKVELVLVNALGYPGPTEKQKEFIFNTFNLTLTDYTYSEAAPDQT